MKWKYVGALGEQRLLTEKDLAGLYYVAQLLGATEESDDFVYVGLGRSPVVITAFIRKFFNVNVFDLPLSIETVQEEYDKRLRDVPYDESMASFLSKYLPVDRLRKRRVVLIDYVDTGYSLDSAKALLQKHLRALGMAREADHVLIAPLTDMAKFLSRADSILTKFDPNTRASHRLLKVLRSTIDKAPFAAAGRMTEKAIRAGSPVPVNAGAAERLESVLDLALDHLGKQNKQLLLKQLASSKYHGPRKRPDRTLQQVFKDLWAKDPMRPPSFVEKEQLVARYSHKSAEAYEIPNGRLAYEGRRLRGAVTRNPGGAIACALLLIFIIYLILRYLLLSPSTSQDRITEL